MGGRYNYKSVINKIVSRTRKKTKAEMSEYMRNLGRKGGKKTAAKGKDYMAKLGKKGYEALAKKKSSQ